MLTENDVVNAMVKYLKKDGFTIQSALSTNEKGIDIEAFHTEKGKCYVEAKGSTSSKSATSRFGKSFNKSQVKVHVGMALIKAFQILEIDPNSTSIIALPHDKNHLNIINSINKSLNKSGVKICFVKSKTEVVEYTV